MIYTFTTSLLSAEKVPNSPTRPLSASGVNVISLSTNDLGISFTPKSTLTGTLCSCTVQGSVFKIDAVYSGEPMILVKTQPARTGTVFTFLSTGTVGTSLSTGFTDFLDGEGLRLRLYGYR